MLKKILIGTLFLTSLMVVQPVVAGSQRLETAEAVFTVKCYDEGKAALQGLKGIKKIETGIHYFKETDTVYYDPKAVTVEEMEAALKKAGTYVGTVKSK
jgi:copper chaperone CopZ